MKTRQLTIDAMLCAACAVLGYVALDLGNIKVTFESLPILLGGLLFGPVDGMLIGGVGAASGDLCRQSRRLRPHPAKSDRYHPPHPPGGTSPEEGLT